MYIWVECGKFFRECRQHFHTTGAILPSSRFLARALVRPLHGPRPAWRILEVGPGTGSVTREIARRMTPADRLDAVEINTRFAELVERRVRQERAFTRCRDQIEIITAAVQDLLGTGMYDLIVSGLPLNNLSPHEVREIFATYNRLLKPGGTLTFYEYTLVRQLKSPFVDRRERRRLFRVGRVMRGYIRDYQIRRERIFINVPPATVRYLRFEPMTPRPAAEKTAHPSSVLLL
ncbi:MAG TPA: methyltransferase domain-containing protein [Gemmataceae bacterium]|nr:methyltransferase domain-containing protein [Gemmataceae bacterium]